MKKIYFWFVILAVIFVFGCNKGTNIVAITGSHVVEEMGVIREIAYEEVIEEETVTVRLCHDTDNGMVRWVNGSVFGYYDNSKRFEFHDYCFNNDILIEYYCENEMPKNMTFVCDHGCADNHCQ